MCLKADWYVEEHKYLVHVEEAHTAAAFEENAAESLDTHHT
jgi:hypothetical protein